MAEIKTWFHAGSGNQKAKNVSYDNAQSKMDATDVQSALDEIKGNLLELNDVKITLGDTPVKELKLCSQNTIEFHSNWPLFPAQTRIAKWRGGLYIVNNLKICKFENGEFVDVCDVPETYSPNNLFVHEDKLCYIGAGDPGYYKLPATNYYQYDGATWKKIFTLPTPPGADGYGYVSFHPMSYNGYIVYIAYVRTSSASGYTSMFKLVGTTVTSVISGVNSCRLLKEINGEIYGIESRIYKYDLELGEKTEIATIPSTGAFPVDAGDKVLLLGGQDTQDFYSWDGETFERLSPLPENALSNGTYYNELIIFGKKDVVKNSNISKGYALKQRYALEVVQ